MEDPCTDLRDELDRQAAKSQALGDAVERWYREVAEYALRLVGYPAAPEDGK